MILNPRSISFYKNKICTQCPLLRLHITCKNISKTFASGNIAHAQWHKTSKIPMNGGKYLTKFKQQTQKTRNDKSAILWSQISLREWHIGKGTLEIRYLVAAMKHDVIVLWFSDLDGQSNTLYNFFCWEYNIVDLWLPIRVTLAQYIQQLILIILTYTLLHILQLLLVNNKKGTIKTNIHPMGAALDMQQMK